MASSSSSALDASGRPPYLSYLPDTVTLPTFWNPRDRGTLLELDKANFQASYKGSGKDEKECAAVRANVSIPPTCAVFYFEVEIIDRGRDGCIGIGLSTDSVALNRLPGWEANSFGLHADDGNIFRHSGKGTPFGPVFGTKDVAGCGFNALTESIFFTLNGRYLGVAFRDVKGVLYPTIGLRTPGEVITANFGQKPFLFDIATYTDTERATLRSRIDQTDISTFASHTSLRSLIQSYLSHHAYAGTSAALADPHPAGANDPRHVSMEKRQQIRNCVLAGDIDGAIALTNQHFDGALNDNPQLLFRLRCARFAEMVRRGSACPDESWLMETMTYGQDLQNDYKNGLSVEDAAHLSDTFSLLAYPNPLQSPVAWLLQPPALAKLARMLNSAIMVHSNMPAAPPLEVAMRQLNAVFDQLKSQGHVAASFVQLQRSFA